MAVDTEIGRRVHRVIGSLAGTDPTPYDVLDVVHALWREQPIGGSTAASARLRCATAASVYFQRCHPAPGWECTSIELTVGDAIADIVWVSGETVVFDELKTGVVDAVDKQVADQLERLAVGGHERFGARFAGVRLVPLGAPNRLAVYNLRHGQLTVVGTPEGMAAR